MTKKIRKKISHSPPPIEEPVKKKLKKRKKIVTLTPPDVELTKDTVEIIEETKVDTPSTTKEKILPQVVSFYGQDIRHIFMNNQWYFSLEDILRIAKVVDPTKLLIDLKNHELLKENYYQLVESFSYYENDNPIVIPIVNYQNFLEILPFIRSFEYFLPGPFPDWLKNMANRSF